MNKKDFLRLVKEKGWTTEHYDIDFRSQDAVLNWNKDVMLKLTKDNKVIYLIVTGQIRIYGKRTGTEFVFKGKSRVSGTLTPYLRKHGYWENNNWFEVHFDEHWGDGGTVGHSLIDAIDEVIEHL